MSEMVERVARIIDPEAWVQPLSMQALGMATMQGGHFNQMLSSGPPEIDMTERQRRRDASLVAARRIIFAMREPTRQMLDAGGASDDWSQGIVSDENLRAAALGVWRSMISAGLKE